MPSLRSQLFLFILKNRHLLQGHLKPQNFFDGSTTIEEFRQSVDRVPKYFGSVPKGVEIESVQIGDLYAEWIRPTKKPNDSAILYFHGGGYVSGTCRAHRTHVSKVVQQTGIDALVFEYRVAPENPFPSALEDAVTAYQYLLKETIPPERIAFMGDSAGGGLCLATLLAIKDRSMPLPSAAVTLSAWTDLACSGDSYRTKREEEPLAPMDSWIVFSTHYVGNNDPCNPLISPLYGDLDGLPPLLMFVGEHEVHHDDTTRFAEKAREAGIDVTCKVGKGMFHCYPVCAPIFPEATAAMNEIAMFIRAHTGAL